MRHTAVIDRRAMRPDARAWSDNRTTPTAGLDEIDVAAYYRRAVSSSTAQRSAGVS